MFFFARQYKKEKRQQPLTRKNLAAEMAKREANKQKNRQENIKDDEREIKQANKQTEYVEK